MKKKFLFLAGALALVACQKEATFVSSEEVATPAKGNFSLSADRYSDENTKTLFSPATETAKATTLWYFDNNNEDELGVFIYDKKSVRDAAETPADKFKTKNAKFTTTKLAHGKKTAVFYGNVTFPALAAADAEEDFYVYAAYPFRGTENEGTASLDMAMAYNTQDDNLKITSLDASKYSPLYSANSYTLFRSNETWRFTGAANEAINNAAVGMNSAQLFGSFLVKFKIPATESKIWIKSIDLEAFEDEEMTTAVEFPVKLVAKPDNFDKYAKKTYENFKDDFVEVNGSKTTKVLRVNTYNGTDNYIEANAVVDNKQKEYSVIIPVFPTEKKIAKFKLTLNFVYPNGASNHLDNIDLTLTQTFAFNQSAAMIAAANGVLNFGEVSPSGAAYVSTIKQLIDRIKEGKTYIKISNDFFGQMTQPTITLPASGTPAEEITLDGFGADDVEFAAEDGTPIKNLILKNSIATTPVATTALWLDNADVTFTLNGKFGTVHVSKADGVVVNDNVRDLIVEENAVLNNLEINASVFTSGNKTYAPAKSFKLGALAYVRGAININSKNPIKVVVAPSTLSEDLSQIGGNLTIAKASEATINVAKINGNVTVTEARDSVSITGDAAEKALTIGTATANVPANVTISGTHGTTKVYTEGILTLKADAATRGLMPYTTNGNVTTVPSQPAELYIYGNVKDTTNPQNSGDMVIPGSAKTIKIGDGTAAVNLNDVTIQESQAEITVNANATLKSLTLFSPKKLIFNGTITNGGLTANEATEVEIGSTAVITGDLNVGTNGGTSLKFDGEKTDDEWTSAPKINGNVSVSKMNTVKGAASVSGKFETWDAETVEITPVAANNYTVSGGFGFFNCNGTVTLDAAAGNFVCNEAAINKIEFINCGGANVTLKGLKTATNNDPTKMINLILGTNSDGFKLGNLTLDACEVNNITAYIEEDITIQKGGTYAGLMNLNAGGDISINGKTGEGNLVSIKTPEGTNETAKISKWIAGNDITVGQYVTFTASNYSSISAKATGALTIGEAEATTALKLLEPLTIEYGTRTATINKAELEKVTSYVDLTLNTCNLKDECLVYAWPLDNSRPPKPIYTDLTFKLDNCKINVAETGADPNWVTLLNDSKATIKALIVVPVDEAISSMYVAYAREGYYGTTYPYSYFVY